MTKTDTTGPSGIDSVWTIHGFFKGSTFSIAYRNLIKRQLGIEENLNNDIKDMDNPHNTFERSKRVLDNLKGLALRAKDQSRGYVFVGRLYGSMNSGGDYESLAKRAMKKYSKEGKEIIAYGIDEKAESAGFAWRKR